MQNTGNIREFDTKYWENKDILVVYALRIKYQLPIWMSNSKINLPGSKMTCPDFCLNHLT